MASPRSGPVLLLQRRCLFGQRQRLVVAVLNQRHVRLVVEDDAEHVVRVHRRGEVLGLTQRRHGFVHAPALRQHDAGQRMKQREVSPVARCMERRCGFGDVLADDRRVADLLVAVAELVVGEADGFGIVRLFGMTQRAAEQRDRAGLVAFRKRDAAMKPPERRKQRGRKVVAGRIRWPSQDRRRPAPHRRPSARPRRACIAGQARLLV